MPAGRSWWPAIALQAILRVWTIRCDRGFPGGSAGERGAPDESLRLEILKSRVALARALHPGFDFPAPVLGFIAKTVTHNGRDLDGALNRLLAHNKLTGHPVTMEMAECAV